MSLVVDASMAVSWLFTDERSEVSRRVLRRVLSDGGNVPSLWRLEVANVLRKAVRRGRCTEVYATRSLARLALLGLAVDSETDARAWGETRRLALAHDLTMYDAAYLELAVRFAQPLASCDAALIRAAKKVGLEAFGL
jgi:predicted nucleic acid-binding protein